MSVSAPLESTGGKVDALDGSFRAHMRYYDENGQQKHIYGPRWPDAAEAQKDLEAVTSGTALRRLTAPPRFSAKKSNAVCF